jgi:hypothetical protein
LHRSGQSTLMPRLPRSGKITPIARATKVAPHASGQPARFTRRRCSADLPPCQGGLASRPCSWSAQSPHPMAEMA